MSLATIPPKQHLFFSQERDPASNNGPNHPDQPGRDSSHPAHQPHRPRIGRQASNNRSKGSRCRGGSSYQPPSSRARRSTAGSTRKSDRPSAYLITSSHRLATLITGVLSSKRIAGLRRLQTNRRPRRRPAAPAPREHRRARSPWQVLAYYAVSDEGSAWVGFWSSTSRAGSPSSSAACWR